MGDTIKLKKGLKANRPALSLSELACDNNAGNERLIYGGINGVVEFPNMEDIKKVTSDLAESVTKTLADITYYVATNGSDTTGNGTNGNPFKTIQFAINKLPQIINHDVAIKVLAGAYVENVVISGFGGKGALSLTGALTATTTHSINNLSIANCSCPVATSGFACELATNTKLSISNCTNVDIDSFTITVPSTADGIKITNSFAFVFGCIISNQSGALATSACSTVLSQNNSGVSNDIGLTAEGASTIGKFGRQPQGTTLETVRSGGVIR